MRLNVQIIEAESGRHLWAERFDKPVADLFDMQEEIVSRLARQLDAVLIIAEARRAAQSPQPNSLDLYFQGMAWVNRGIALDYLERAGDFFKRALASDPDDVGALTGTGWVELTLAGAYTTDDRTTRIETAKAALNKALSLAPGCAPAHMYLGRIGIFTNHGHEAISRCERALALDRNLAAAHATIGLALIFIGRAEETEARIGEALRISPRDTAAASWMATAGYAQLYLGRDEEAVAWYNRVAEIDRNLPNAHFYHAVALAHLGRQEGARAAVADGLEINPSYTIKKFRAGTFSDNPTFLSQRERIYDGMRKAGVPEG